jgi:hypothetical protein
VNFFMNKFKKLGLIEYSGGLKINSARLSILLHDGSSIRSPRGSSHGGSG